MPTYQANIPTGIIPLDQDYLNLQGNFQQLNIAYGVDHVPFTDTSGIPPAGITGMHTAIHLVPVSTVASNMPNNQPINGYTAVSGYGQLFDAQINDGINTDEALFYLSGGNRLIQLTRNFVPTALSNGATFLPGGLILNWGAIPIASNPTPTIVTFTQPYTADLNVFSITVTRISSDTSSTANDIRVVTGSVNKTQFSVIQSSSSSSSSMYWMALGK